MAITTQFWPNGQLLPQIETCTINGISIGGTLTATINSKNVTYTISSADTLATATTNWLALLTATAQNGPAEFTDATFSSTTAGNIIVTASTPGTPFTITFSSTGSSTSVSQFHTQANSSPSDVANPQNWLRGNFPGLPQSGDDIVFANTSVPVLWNLTALQNIVPNSITRWQSFTGTIGLPIVNPSGYQEYRPTDLTFGVSSGSSSSAAPGSGPCVIRLGVSDPSTGGSGPTRERYNFGSMNCDIDIFAAGSPQDAYSVAILNTNALSTLNVIGCSVAVAMPIGQTSQLQSLGVDGGGTLSVGAGVTILGLLNFNNGSGGIVNCAPGTLTLQNGSSATVGGQGLTYQNVNAFQSSTLSWLSNSNIQNLVLQTGGTLDKSGDFRGITIVNSTIDGDTCQINDPLSAISWTNPTTVKGSVTSGPFVFTGPRNVKVS